MSPFSPILRAAGPTKPSNEHFGVVDVYTDLSLDEPPAGDGSKFNRSTTGLHAVRGAMDYLGSESLSLARCFGTPPD